MAEMIATTMMAGAAISAAGAIGQANAAKAAATYNAELRERDAFVAMDQATQDAERVARQSRVAAGSLIAGTGASGGDTTDVLDVLRSSYQESKLDEANILYKGRLKAMGYRESAELDRYQGDVAQQQGYLNSASQFLVGAGRTTWSYADATRLRRTE